MFEHHFGLRENPFLPAISSSACTRAVSIRKRAHTWLRHRDREPFLLITGEVGTGKTTSLTTLSTSGRSRCGWR